MLEHGWFKLKHRSETLAIVGAYTGPAAAPTGLILGRYFDDRQLHIVARTAPPPAGLRTDLVVEIATDHGRRWCHLARLLDIRAELHPIQVSKGLTVE